MLEAELKALRHVANQVSNFAYARGLTTIDNPRDVPMRIRQIAIRGVREGAMTALAVAQIELGQDLGALEPKIPEE